MVNKKSINMTIEINGRSHFHLQKYSVIISVYDTDITAPVPQFRNKYAQRI